MNPGERNPDGERFREPVERPRNTMIDRNTTIDRNAATHRNITIGRNTIIETKTPRAVGPLDSLLPPRSP